MSRRTAGRPRRLAVLACARVSAYQPGGLSQSAHLGVALWTATQVAKNAQCLQLAAMSEGRSMPATESLPSRTSTLSQARLYLRRQAASPARYVLEQGLQGMVGGWPTIIGIGLRAVLYRLMLRMDGTAAIERNVRLRDASLIPLGPGRSPVQRGLFPP